MKRSITNLTACLLALVCAFSFTACKGTEEQTFDDTKTQIFVETFEGGYGVEWLEKIKTRFEEKYKDYKLTDASGNERVGVEIIIEASDTTGPSVPTHLSVTNNEVFFLEICDYDTYVSRELVLDITDAVTEPLTEYDESESIYDKLDPVYKSYLKKSGSDGNDRFYGVPYAMGFEGLIYDEDMFFAPQDNAAKGFYYSKKYDDGQASGVEDRFISRVSQKFDDGKYVRLTDVGGQKYYATPSGEYLSKGPDGKYGTYDDGQPATYADFFALCAVMDSRSITPFTWTGASKAQYLGWLFGQLVGDHEGKEQMQVFYDAAGKAQNLVSVDGGTVTPIDKGLDITPENHERMVETAGRYYAARFFETLFENKNYIATEALGTSTSQYDAQEDFLYSKKDPDKYGFLADGCWWENEARRTFDEMSTNFGDEYKKENRNFKMLSLPKATGNEVGKIATVIETHNTLAFARADVGNKEDLIKKFLRACFTDRSNREFTTTTNTLRPYNYTLSGSELNSMSSFGRNIYDYLKGENKSGDIVYSLSTTRASSVTSGKVDIAAANMVTTKIDGVVYRNIVEIFNNYNAEQVFKGMKSYIGG